MAYFGKPTNAGEIPFWDGSRFITASLNKADLLADFPSYGTLRMVTIHSDFMYSTGVGVAPYYVKPLFGGNITEGITFTGSLGVVALNTGLSPSGSIMVRGSDVQLRQNHVYFNSRLTNEPSTSAQRFKVVTGFLDPAVASMAGETDGVFFLYRDDLNSGNWIISTMSSSVTTSINTSVGITSGTSMQTFEIYINNTPNIAQFYIDGTFVGAISTSFWTGATTTNPITYISKSIGTTSKTCYLDSMTIRFIRNAGL